MQDLGMAQSNPSLPESNRSFVERLVSGSWRLTRAGSCNKDDLQAPVGSSGPGVASMHGLTTRSRDVGNAQALQKLGPFVPRLLYDNIVGCNSTKGALRQVCNAALV